MKASIMLVLTVLFVCFFPVFAGDIIVNNQTGEVKVKEDPWRQASLVEVEAYQNPEKEVPVWSSTNLTKIDFFHKGSVKTATNVVVYSDGKIQSVAKEVVETQNIFLGYKPFLMITILLMVVGNIMYVKNVRFGFVFTISFVSILSIMIAFICSYILDGKYVSFASFVIFLSLLAVALSVTAYVDDCDGWYKIWSTAFYVMASIAMIV